MTTVLYKVKKSLKKLSDTEKRRFILKRNDSQINSKNENYNETIKKELSETPWGWRTRVSITINKKKKRREEATKIPAPISAEADSQAK